MIAKIITGKDINAVIAYNLDKVEKGKAVVLSAPNCMTKSVTENDFTGMRKSDFVRSFQSRLDANIRTEKPVSHIILSLKENDKDDDTLREIASKYMTAMGYGSQPYIVVRHSDIENVHLHIVTVKVGLDGRKLDDSYERVRSNNARKALEEEYGLVRAEKERLSKSEKYSRDISLLNEYIDKISFRPDAVSYGEEDLKGRIGTVLRFVREYHCIDGMRAYNRVLSRFNVSCYEVNGVNSKGVPYTGVEYCVVNSKGEQVSRGISGSSFGRHYSSKGLRDRFERERFTMRHDKVAMEARKAVRYVLTSILAKYPSGISEGDLRSELSKHGISVRLFRNEEGRLYGVTFSDDMRKVELKGSDVGYQSGVLSGFLVDDGLSVGAEEQALVMKAVRRVYAEIRRRDYYYESDLINNLSDRRSEILGSVTGRVGETPHAALIVDRFIRERYSSLSEVVARETSYFASQSAAAVSYAAGLDPRLRADFLYGMGIVSDGGRLCSARNRRLFVESDLRVGPRSSRARLFGKQERELLKVIASGGLNDVTFETDAYLSVFRYVSPENLLAVRRKMVSDTVNRIISSVRDWDDMKEVIGALLERGYVVHPLRVGDRTEYYVGDVFEKPESYVRLSDLVSSELDGTNYERVYGSIREKLLTRKGLPKYKYRMLVEIMRCGVYDNRKRLDRQIADLEKRNAVLAAALTKLLMRGDYESMAGLVKGYPSDSLSAGRKMRL